MSKLTDTLATMPRAASTEEDERAAEKLRQDQHNYVENAIATLKQQKGKLSYDEEAFARMDAFRAWVNENIHVEDFSEPIRSILREYERAEAREREARETDLEYLHRVRPQWSDAECMQVIFLSAITHQRVKDVVRSPVACELWEESEIGANVTASTTPTCNNTSTGILLLSPDKQSLFIQQRQKFPWGWACPAGHVDEGETYIRAAIRELKEETGLDAGDDIHLILEADVDNQCRRPNGSWHHWRVYQASASGLVVENKDEAEGAGWYPLSRVQELARRTEAYRAGLISEEAWQAEPGLEGVWYDFLVARRLITPTSQKTSLL